VLTPVELASRFDVYAEQYIHAVEVEAKLSISIAKTQIYPAAMTYLSSLTDTLTQAAALKIEASTDTATKVAGLTKTLTGAVAKLSETLAKHDFSSTEQHLVHTAKTLKPAMDEVRKAVDSLEAEVADEDWPLPTYQEMLFIK